MEVQAEKSFMDITDYVILGSGSDNESIHSGMAATGSRVCTWYLNLGFVLFRPVFMFLILQ